nr:hypothetical protein [Tanacetum cinerariifolium]
SSDSSEESVGTSTGRVILFGTILTTIPDTTLSMIPPSTHVDTTPIPIAASTTPPSLDITPASPDYTLASPDYLPVSNTEFDPSKSPTTSSALQRRVMILTPGQPILHGQPYRYHLNGLVHMMTARKRVGPLPTHRLAVRHSVYYSSSDHFSLDDSLRDSSSSSSSETSLDSSADALSNFASSHSSSDHSLPAPSSGMRPSHHLCSLVPSIPRLFAAISARPSHDSSSVSLSCKRSRSSKIATNLEVSSKDRFEPYVPRGTDLEIDVDVVRSDGIEIDPEIRAEIDECIAYADALRDRGIDSKVVVEVVDRDEVGTDVRGPVEVKVDRVTHPVIADDILEPAQNEGAVEVTYETLGDLVQRLRMRH